MRKFFPKNFPWHFPKSKKEEQEFGKAKKDIFVCKACNCFYWYKSWHHSLDDYPELKETKDIKFTLCPACRMIKEKKYEGEILLENVSDKKEEIENLISNFSEIAFDRDPMARIISIEEVAKGMLRVLTTENQIAKKLAKKIAKAYKGKIFITYSKRESTIRIRVVLGL
jgi:hypothetical protein